MKKIGKVVLKDAVKLSESEMRGIAGGRISYPCGKHDNDSYCIAEVVNAECSGLVSTISGAGSGTGYSRYELEHIVKTYSGVCGTGIWGDGGMIEPPVEPIFNITCGQSYLGTGCMNP